MTTHQVLLTNRLGIPYGQVPADGLSYEEKVGGGGSASVTIRLDHPVISGVNTDDLDTWSTEMLVLRDGEPVADGPVVNLDTDAMAGKVGVQAASAPHWLSRRRVRRDLEFNQDQAEILTALVAYAQDPAEKGPHADCRLTVDAPTTGVVRARAYLGSEQAQIGDLVQALAELDGGFDLTVALQLAGGVTQRILRAHYPLAGADVDTPLVLGRGGLDSLTVKRPGDQVATRIYAVGNGEGSDQVTATALSDAPVEERYGVHELPLSATDVKETATLQAFATGALVLRRPPLLVVGASYTVTAATPYDLCALGDRVPIRADRGWLQLDERLRVVGRKVTVSPSGREKIDLTFNTALEAA